MSRPARLDNVVSVRFAGPEMERLRDAAGISRSRSSSDRLRSERRARANACQRPTEHVPRRGPQLRQA